VNLEFYKNIALGGFYQDEFAYVGATSYGLGCKQCPPGTYVKPKIAPGKSKTDCQSCPQGKQKLVVSVYLVQRNIRTDKIVF
jgi:hypothetical protein